MTTKFSCELLAERAALEVQIEQVKNIEREAAITQIQELMALLFTRSAPTNCRRSAARRRGRRFPRSIETPTVV